MATIEGFGAKNIGLITADKARENSRAAIQRQREEWEARKEQRINSLVELVDGAMPSLESILEEIKSASNNPETKNSIYKRLVTVPQLLGPIQSWAELDTIMSRSVKYQAFMDGLKSKGFSVFHSPSETKRSKDNPYIWGIELQISW